MARDGEQNNDYDSNYDAYSADNEYYKHMKDKAMSDAEFLHAKPVDVFALCIKLNDELKSSEPITDRPQES